MVCHGSGLFKTSFTVWVYVSLCFQGATIYEDEETGTMKIARVMHGGAADRCGKMWHHWRLWEEEG